MVTLDQNAGVHETTVIERRELATGVVLVSLDAPLLAKATRPGQYVMAIPPSGEAAATALAIYEAEGKRASLLFFITGKRTRELSELRSGDRLDVVGPLGNGFDLSEPPRDVAIVAGGVGIASVLLLRASVAAQRVARAALLRRANGGTARRRRTLRRGRLRARRNDRRRQPRRAWLRYRRARASAPTRSESTRAVRRRCCAASRASRSGSACARSFRSKRRSGAASAVVGAASCRLSRERASAEFSAGSTGGSDVVYARVCKEGPVFWADELRW